MYYEFYDFFSIKLQINPIVSQFDDEGEEDENDFIPIPRVSVNFEDTLGITRAERDDFNDCANIIHKSLGIKRQLNIFF